jgi:hypothetical protein
MRIRTVAALMVAIVPGVATAQNVKLNYAPGTAKYQVSSQTHITQEMMGQKQDIDLNSDQKLTFSATAKAGGLLDFTVSLDTIAMTNSMAGPTDVSKMIGTKYTGVMNPNGKVVSGDVTVPVGGDVTSAPANGVRLFMPVLTGATKVGGTWTDTVTSVVTQGSGAQIKATTVTNYTLVGDTTYDGQKSWKVQHDVVTTLAGKGSNQGTEFTMEGTSKAGGMSYFSQGGVYIGRTTKEETNLTVTVEAAGLVIPVTQATTVKVSLIK